jgi:hypothetical protein
MHRKSPSTKDLSPEPAGGHNYIKNPAFAMDDDPDHNLDGVEYQVGSLNKYIGRADPAITENVSNKLEQEGRADPAVTGKN